jgi:hypothetical protein
MVDQEMQTFTRRSLIDSFDNFTVVVSAWSFRRHFSIISMALRDQISPQRS